MSPAGWPKGKPRGPFSPERLGQHKARSVRGRKKWILTQLSLAGGLGRAPEVDISPAVYRTVREHIGDSEYVEDGLDECLLRALHKRLVYAGSVCTHHEPPLQEITIEVIAATERYHIKRAKSQAAVPKRGLSLPAKRRIFTERPLTPRQLEVIGLLAKGLSRADIARQLGITERTVKMHCDVLRSKLGVGHVREIPFAYKEKSGEDPFSLIAVATPVVISGTPLTTVVDAMFAEPGDGKPLLTVVSEMFDS